LCLAAHQHTLILATIIAASAAPLSEELWLLRLLFVFKARG